MPAPNSDGSFSSLPILDLSWADDPKKKPELLEQLRDVLYNIGFLYIINHGVRPETISKLTRRLPLLFDMPTGEKRRLSKLNSPSFLGYSGFAEEVTLGKKDLREQYDFATELSIVYDPDGSAVAGKTDGHESRRDFSRPYWRLRGPNQWPSEHFAPDFRQALTAFVASCLLVATLGTADLFQLP